MAIKKESRNGNSIQMEFCFSVEISCFLNWPSSKITKVSFFYFADFFLASLQKLAKLSPMLAQLRPKN